MSSVINAKKLIIISIFFFQSKLTKKINHFNDTSFGNKNFLIIFCKSLFFT